MTKDANDWTTVRLLKTDREELYLLRDDLVHITLDLLTTPLSEEARQKLLSEPLLRDEDVELLRGTDGPAYARGIVVGFAIKLARRIMAAITPPEELEQAAGKKKRVKT